MNSYLLLELFTIYFIIPGEPSESSNLFLDVWLRCRVDKRKTMFR
jgi:hypothetical protein